MTSAGIHCRITSAIRIHVITVNTIGRREIMVVDIMRVVVLAGRLLGAMVIRQVAVLAGNPVLVLVSLVAGLASPGLIVPVLDRARLLVVPVLVGFNRQGLLITKRGVV